MDFDAYAIRTKFEDEEKLRVINEEKEAALRAQKKSNLQKFKENLYHKETL